MASEQQDLQGGTSTKKSPNRADPFHRACKAIAPMPRPSTPGADLPRRTHPPTCREAEGQTRHGREHDVRERRQDAAHEEGRRRLASAALDERQREVLDVLGEGELAPTRRAVDDAVDAGPSKARRTVED